jgi:hypothetical protein
MFYYLHLLLLAPIYSLVSSLLLRDQNHEILLLRQQLLIRHRQLGRKPAYGRLESWLCCWQPCAFLSGVWPRLC